MEYIFLITISALIFSKCVIIDERLTQEIFHQLNTLIKETARYV